MHDFKQKFLHHRVIQLILAIFGVFFSSRLCASSVEAAASYYWDQQLTAVILSVTGGYETRQFFSGEGLATSFRIGSTEKSVQFKKIGDLLEKQLDGKKSITQHALSLAVDQGLAVGTQVGLLGGLVDSPLNKSRYIGARGSQWWLLESLQTTLEVRSTKSTQPVLDYTDTDGKRVITPADVEGTNATATAMHLTTPTTILRGALSRTMRSDRPPADSLSLEVRQFVSATRSAVHVALSHYENVGPLEAKTQYGTIVANSVRAEWHQRLQQRLIVMGGYRYYIEVENPRAADAANNQVGADSIYSSWRWRFGDGVWTDDSHELYGFMARYTTNAPTTAYIIGFGGRYLL